MSRSWPFAVAVIVVGGLAGVAIAGRPVPRDSFVLDPSVVVAASTSSTSVAAFTPSTPAPATPTTIAAATTAPASTSAAPTIAPSSEAPTTTVATAEAPTSTPIPATPGPLPRTQVRLVIANGDGRFGLASVTADRIRSLGYIIDLGDAVRPVDATVVYYRPGFDDEAAYAAIDIGVPDAIIFALPTNTSQPITNSDDRGDIIIVLGPDAPR
jgi:hypothetical protein